MNTLNSIIAKYNLKNNFFKIITYPLYSIVTNTIVLVLSMKNIFSKIYSNKELRMFSEDKAINNYWYDTMALNLQKHGRLGYSKTTMDNDYLVGKWFHISKYSLFPFWKSSVLTILLSWILIPVFFFFLYPSVPLTWFLSVSFLTIIGSTFYSQLESQNYNIMGWVLYPLLFWGIENNDLTVLVITICLLFLTSFTAYFVSFGYLATAILLGSLTINEFLFIELFSIPLILYRFYPIFIKGELKSHFLMVGNTIGLVNSSEEKYTRNIKNKKAVLLSVIKLSCLIGFILCVDYVEESYYLMLVLGYQTVNSFIARFADRETIDMLVILTSFYFILKSESLIELFLYWCLISNPLPKLNFINDSKNFFKLKTLDPFHVNKLNNKLINFLSKIKTDRVFISFDDPLYDYDKIFSGQRILIEPIHFHASQQDILLLPNLWSTISEKKSDLNIWGRDAKTITEIMMKGDFNYMIYYTISDEQIPEEIKENFSICDSIQWNSLLPESFSDKQNISWHLLKIKS